MNHTDANGPVPGLADLFQRLGYKDSVALYEAVSQLIRSLPTEGSVKSPLEAWQNTEASG